MRRSVVLGTYLLVPACSPDPDARDPNSNPGADDGGADDDTAADPTGTDPDSSSDTGQEGDSSDAGDDAGDTGTSTDGTCGNGVVEDDEECDDGNDLDGDTCESDCTLPACGNGIVDRYEMCLPNSGESFEVDGSPERIALGDLDEDGLLDLLVLDRDGSVTRMLQHAKRGFGPAVQVEHEASRVALGDVDADGHLDLLALHKLQWCPNESGLSIGSWITIGRGLGDGTFAPSVSVLVGMQAEDWAIGDLDDDERIDIAVADSCTSEISVLFNSGDQDLLLPRQTFPSPVSPHAIVLGDVNRDWIPDLVAASNGADAASVEVFLASGDGAYVHELSLPAGREVYDLAAIDVEPNGALDILTTDPTQDRIRIQIGRPEELFPDYLDVDANGKPTHLWVGDVDGHAHGDIATAREKHRTISLSIGIGALESWWIHTVDLDAVPGPPVFGDINGDGATDLAVPLQDGRITIVLAQP